MVTIYLYIHVSVILILNDLCILYIPGDVATIHILTCITFHDFLGTRRKIPCHIAPCNDPNPHLLQNAPKHVSGHIPTKRLVVNAPKRLSGHIPTKVV